MRQTIILQRHINDVVLLPVPRGLKTEKKLNRYKKNVLKPTGRSDKNFRVVNLFTGSIFAIILFCTMMLFGSQAWASLSFVPPG